MRDPQQTAIESSLGFLAAESEFGDRYALHTQYLNGTMVRMLRTIGYDIGFCSGRGQYLFDRRGERYLDLLSGWGVFGIGRNHPKLRAVLVEVLMNDFPNLPQMDVSVLAGLLAEQLIHRVSFLDKVLFLNSGSEAVEAAIKLARRATGRPGLVYCAHAFHGLSCGALSLNGHSNFRDNFGPLLPNCTPIPFNDLTALEKVLRGHDIAAFIVEPIQGHGVNMPDDGYLASAQDLCRKYRTLFIADEIQTGLGRTGRFLAVEHWGVEPDMVLISKTLSGGHVPVAAVLARKWIFDKVFDRMDRAVILNSTFAMSDLAMAAGLATLEVLETEKLISNAAQQGARLRAMFEAMLLRYEMVAQVRGMGLMIGVEFGRPRSLKLQAAWHTLEAVSAGLFCQLITIPLLKDHKILAQVAGHGSHTVKILPSLVISDEDCEWIGRAFDAVINASHRVPGAVWSLGKTLTENVWKGEQGRNLMARPPSTLGAAVGRVNGHDRSQSS
jgi:ornithine--oxo-acid transaminase